MHIDVLQRDDTACPSGEAFYSCRTNNFRGCCSVDPCHLDDCPLPVFLDITADEDTSASATATGAEFTMTLTTESSVLATTMTDSGTTRTIPNRSRVTVTKKTTIVTNKSPVRTPTWSTSWTTQTGSSSFTTTDGTSQPAETSSSGSADGGRSSTRLGAIVGGAVGGVIVAGILAILAVMFLKRRRGLHRSNSNATSNGGAGLQDFGEKQPQSMSAHTTGSSDPFAPFGGRVDKPEDPLAPRDNTYEMDATSVAPVELPAISVGAQPRPRTETQPSQKNTPVDPRANLNASLTDRTQNTYVNHWNQYRTLEQQGG